MRNSGAFSVASTTSIPSASADKTSIGSERWLAVYAIAATSFVLVTTEFLPVGLLTSIARDLHVTEGVAGLMVTMPGLVAAIFSPLMTLWTGTLDRRHILMGLTACLLASALVSAVATSLIAMLFARFLLGLAIGGFWAIGAGMSARLVSGSKVARATSLIFAGISIGTVVGVPAGAYIGADVGWRAAFWLVAALTSLALIAQARFLPKLQARHRVRFADLLVIFKPRNARVGLAAVVFAISGQFAAYTFVNPVLLQITHVSVASLAQMLLVYGAAGIAGNFLGGWAAARNIRFAAVATLLLLALSIIAFDAAASNLVWTAIALGFWGAAFGATPILLQLWMLRASPGIAEGGSALFVSAFQVSIAIGAACGGAFVDAIGLTTSLIAGAGSALIGFLVLLSMSRRFDAREPA